MEGKQRADTIPEAPEKPAALTGHSAKLASITISLSDLIQEETRLLGKRLTSEAKRLHGPKNRLMAEYKETLQLLQVNEKLLGPKDSPVRHYIKKLTDRFREILRAHARIVLRLKSVAEGIVKSVGEEVIKRNRPIVGYNNNAGFRVPTQIPPTSLQLNQVI